MELILGIDDAGRGPVIGPMILAGVLIQKNKEKELKKLGVKDSKQLTPRRREFIATKIKELAEIYEIEISHPDDIDHNLNNGTNLNIVEANMVANIINRTNKGFKKLKIIIDCPSVSIIKWTDVLKTKIENLSNLEISCEHKADKNHIAVSAASIIAKHIREKEMTKLKEKYGSEIGTGYCHDPNTCRFLEKYAEKHQKDGIFRQTWETWKKACANIHQRKLF